jgi:hypothetical protein
MARGPMCAKGRPNRAEMGLGRSAQAGRTGPFRRRFGPPFLEREDDATLTPCGRRHSQRREPFAREAIHKLERKDRREIIHEEDHPTQRKQPQVEEDVEALPRHPRRRRKTPSKASP